MGRRYKWVPNAISISRSFPLAVLIFVCALRGYWLAAAIISVVAIATDCIDGWLAFRLDARSKLGSIIDPISDFALSVAQIAGAVLTATISWKLVWLLTALFLVLWPPVVLVKNKTANKIFLSLDRSYYAAVIVGFTALYFYKALGVNAAWLILPALPLAILGAHSSIGRHKIS